MATPSVKSTIVLVTGANQGIGLEIVRKLASENQNYHVLLSGRRKDAVWEAAAKLQEQKLSVEPLVLDVTSDASIAEAVRTVTEKHGHLDCLVVNAGITGSGFPGSLRDQMRHVYDTNVFGAAAVTEAFAPLLARAPGARRVVFLSTVLSSMARKADPADHLYSVHEWMPYSTSKSALNMVALHLAARYAGEDGGRAWKLNICCPGHCGTNLNNFAGGDTPANGAIMACRLATNEDMDGPTGTFTDRNGTVPW